MGLEVESEGSRACAVPKIRRLPCAGGWLACSFHYHHTCLSILGSGGGSSPCASAQRSQQTMGFLMED